MTITTDHTDHDVAILQSFVAQYGFDAGDLDAPREHGLTPLMRAALLGRLDLLDALLRHGVRHQARNADGNNALWLGCVSNRADVVRRLIEADVAIDNQNETGATALMYAASSGKTELVAVLLASGADPHVVNQDGAKAVDMAANLSCLQLLRHTAA